MRISKALIIALDFTTSLGSAKLFITFTVYKRNALKRKVRFLVENITTLILEPTIPESSTARGECEGSYNEKERPDLRPGKSVLISV